MRLDEAAEAVFARHETFHPRWGWVKKAYDAASRSPHAFNADDATLRLGVGKNMVRSIRFWDAAAKVLEDVPDPERPRQQVVLPTASGRTLFSDNAYDPYTEDPGSLWLLHWRLLAPPCLLPVWWAAFNEFGAVEFSDEDLEAFVADQVQSMSSWTAPHPSTIGKDVSCLLRTYALSVSSRQAFDDLVDCPLRELGLLRTLVQGRRVYRFNVGPKPTLPPAVALFVALDFLARSDDGSRTVTMSRLATEPGGPGRAFKLSEADLGDLIERAVAVHRGVRIARPAGITQLGFDEPAATLADKVLASYFAASRRTPTSHDPNVTAPVAGRVSDRGIRDNLALLRAG